MQFSPTNDGGGKAGKFMLVAGLHVALGAFFIHSMHSRHVSLSAMQEQVLVMLEPERVEPPPPVPPPEPRSMPTLPPLFVPPTEVPVVVPPDTPPPLYTTTTAPDAAPLPVAPSHTAPELPPATQLKADSGRMRTAVLADAKSCALPDYPARAARDGSTGTTLLALLVGTDGRVTSSRIERSSGSRELDRAAVNALSLCRFQPATSNGVAEAAWAQLAYVWTLD